MKHLLALIGVFATAVFVAVSAAINWQFGMSLGHSELDAQLFAAVSASADMLKAVLPLIALYHWRSMARTSALIAVIIWIPCTVYSMTSSLGFTALNQAALLSVGTKSTQTETHLTQRIVAVKLELTELPRTSPLPTLETEVQSIRRQPRWISTKQCTDDTVQASVVFCDRYRANVRDLNYALSRDSLRAQLKHLQARLLKTRHARSPNSFDPRGTFIANLLDIDTASVNASTNLLLAFMLEIASGLGLLTIFSLYDTPHRPHPTSKCNAVRLEDRKVTEKRGLPKDFHVQILATGSEERTLSSDIYARYREWCVERNVTDIMSPQALGRSLTQHGIARRKIGGKVYYTGVQLRP